MGIDLADLEVLPEDVVVVVVQAIPSGGIGRGAGDEGWIRLVRVVRPEELHEDAGDGVTFIIQGPAIHAPLEAPDRCRRIGNGRCVRAQRLCAGCGHDYQREGSGDGDKGGQETSGGHSTSSYHAAAPFTGSNPVSFQRKAGHSNESNWSVEHAIGGGGGVRSAGSESWARLSPQMQLLYTMPCRAQTRGPGRHSRASGNPLAAPTIRSSRLERLKPLLRTVPDSNTRPAGASPDDPRPP